MGVEAIRRVVFFPGVATIAASIPALGTAAPLPPTSKWNVDFSDAACLASREYGTTAEPVTLALKAPAIGDTVQLIVLKGRTSEKGNLAEQRSGLVTVGGSAAQKVSVLTYPSQAVKRRTYVTNIQAAKLAGAGSGSSSLKLDFGGSARLDLDVGGFGGLMKVVDRCVLDLQTVWNAVPMVKAPNGSLERLDNQIEPRAGGGTRAHANLASFFKDSDYPESSQRDEVSGRVEFVLLVDEAGKIADCTVTKTSGVAALDAQSCIILRSRAKFEPARDASGRAVKDGKVSTVIWRLP